MGGPSKERRWGETIRHAEQRARETRFIADVAACDAWNYRMEGYGGPAQPSPPIGDALNAGFQYLEVKYAGCSTHSTVDLTTLRRSRETPIWQLEQRMRTIVLHGVAALTRGADVERRADRAFVAHTDNW